MLHEGPEIHSHLRSPAQEKNIFLLPLMATALPQVERHRFSADFYSKRRERFHQILSKCAPSCFGRWEFFFNILSPGLIPTTHTPKIQDTTTVKN